MKKVMVSGLVSVFVLSLSLFAGGIPIQKSLVPADAKWMVHFDMAKFRNSRLHDFLMEENFTRSFRKWNSRLNKELDMDVIRDMSSLTVFNAGHEERTIVGCFRGRFDNLSLLEKIRGRTEVDEIKSGSHTLLHWNRREYAVFAEKDLILYSNDRKAIENALKSLPSKGKDVSFMSEVAKDVPSDAMMFAFMKNPGYLLGIPSKSKFLDKIGTALYYVSENADIVRSSLRVETQSREDAENIQDLIKGMMAMVRLQAGEEYEEIKYLEDVKFEITGNRMEIRMSAPADEIFKILRKRMKLAAFLPAGNY